MNTPTKDAAWIESSDVLSLFPTCVWNIQVKPETCRAIRADVSETLARLRAGLDPLEPGQTWQSDQDLHRRDELSRLVACINDATRSVLRFLKIGHENFEITGCWANINARGSSHAIHAHPNNFLSGVYYVDTRPGADTINFHDPRPQAAVIRPPVTALTGQNTDQVVVRVKNGTLLLFPAYLQHSVGPNSSEEERISISFNVMFSAFAETLGKPMW